MYRLLEGRGSGRSERHGARQSKPGEYRNGTEEAPEIESIGSTGVRMSVATLQEAHTSVSVPEAETLLERGARHTLY